MKKSIQLCFLILILLSAFLISCTPTGTQPTENTQNAENEKPAPIAPTLYSEVSSETLKLGQHPYSYIATTGEEIRYLLYVPGNYDQHADWPMIVFLHGQGSDGENLDLLIKQGGLPAFVENKTDFEFIVFSPQLPSGRWGKSIHVVDELLNHLNQTLSVDTNRLYLTGLSLGGLGVWQYALEYPDRFAALAPIAGAVPSSSNSVPDNICILNEISIWVFHGEADKIIRPDLDKAVVSELEACGTDIQFTLYPDVDHMGTWPLAYADPSLYEWFLEITK